MRNSVAAICAVVVIFALLTIGVRNARDAARRMKSSNNLKQLGLSLLNYESSYNRLPPGADPDKRHGWLYRCLPYIESSPLYTQIDPNYAWDHPFNAMHFRLDMPVTSNPLVRVNFSESGFGLSHYVASARLFHIDSGTQLSDFQESMGATWCVAERFGSMRAWGSPYNWCSLRDATRTPDEMFLAGGAIEEIQVVMLDASVRSITMDAPAAELEVFGDSVGESLPDAQLTQPPCDKSYFENIELKKEWLDFDDVPQDQRHSKRGRYNFVSEYLGKKSIFLESRSQEHAQSRLSSLSKMYPDAVTIVLGNILDDQAAGTITAFAKLENLLVDGSLLSEASLAALATHPALCVVEGLDEDDARRLDAIRSANASMPPSAVNTSK